MNIEKNCQTCKYYKDGYCENLELKPCYPQKGCDDFSKRNELNIECDDAISRQAVLDAFWKLNVELRPNAIDGILNMVNDMPPVNPQPKTGHWIVHPKGIYAHLVCDKCLASAPYNYRTNYCPNCGAKMQEDDK